jgi:hypothetical protein
MPWGHTPSPPRKVSTTRQPPTRQPTTRQSRARAVENRRETQVNVTLSNNAGEHKICVACGEPLDSTWLICPVCQIPLKENVYSNVRGITNQLNDNQNHSANQTNHKTTQQTTQTAQTNRANSTTPLGNDRVNLRVIRSLGNEWIAEHNKESLSLKRREGYINTSVKVHYLREDEMASFEVRVMYNNYDKKYVLVDVLGKKISMKNGILVIKTNGKMYMTPDRDNADRVKFPDESVLCHCSFSNDEVFFAGILSVTEGIPTSLCNESGTFYPGMVHTTRIRNILAKIMHVGQETIGLDFAISDDTLSEQIHEMLNKGYEKEIQNLMSTFFREGADEYCGNIMLSAYDDFRSRHPQAQEPSQESSPSQPPLSQQQECVICNSNPKTILLLPCKHLSMCQSCSVQVIATDNRCPSCRANIEDVVENIFIA